MLFATIFHSVASQGCGGTLCSDLSIPASWQLLVSPDRVPVEGRKCTKLVHKVWCTPHTRKAAIFFCKALQNSQDFFECLTAELLNRTYYQYTVYVASLPYDSCSIKKALGEAVANPLDDQILLKLAIGHSRGTASRTEVEHCNRNV